MGIQFLCDCGLYTNICGSKSTFHGKFVCDSMNILIYSFQENLVELKHHKLVRSIRSGTVSRELKPNAKTRDQLNV